MRSLLPVLFIIFLVGSCKEKEGLESDQAVKISCVLSQLTYCSNPQQTIEKYLPGWKVIWNPEAVNGNYAFGASDGKSFAIAIRGSLLEFSWQAFQNWIYQDINITEMKPWEYTQTGSKAKIALGAYVGWENLCKLRDQTTGQTLLNCLDSATRKNTPILITGHSLGGNLASVYASWLWHQVKEKGNRKNIKVITFGAPAAGDVLFADDFAAKFPGSLRLENTHDMIPKFPCKGKMKEPGNYYSPSPLAANISVGYKFFTTTLANVFNIMNKALVAIAAKNNGSYYTQPPGKLITIPLSGKYSKNEIDDWLNEAAYQHFIEQYAAALGVPVISCNDGNRE